MAAEQGVESKLVLVEDFESTEVGQIPSGYAKKGSVSVVSDVFHSGAKSLRLDAAVKGPRQIVKQGAELVALGGQHWGRLYFKVQMPSPLPPEGKIVHTTMVAGAAKSPLFDDPIEVRVMGTLLNTKGTFQYMYNVQPRKERKEFGVSTKSIYKFSDEWTLAEWFVDYDSQAYKFYINGEELTALTFKKGETNFAGAEIPKVFENLSFGWYNYQPVEGDGFVAWIDDLALGKERIGDRVIQSGTTAGRKP